MLCVKCACDVMILELPAADDRYKNNIFHTAHIKNTLNYTNFKALTSQCSQSRLL